MIDLFTIASVVKKVKTMLSTKADKVVPSEAGNIATLDENGNLVDSDTKPSDFASAEHNHDSEYASINHNHDSEYSAIDHNHDEYYASIEHNHDTDYAAIDHNHDSDYAAIDHTHTVTKEDVGLGNVDNTSDANKPVSTATQTALSQKADKSVPATEGNIAVLDANGNLNDGQHQLSDFAVVTHDHDSAYAAIDHNHDEDYAAIGHTHTKADIGLGNVDNTSDRDKPVSTAMSTALSGKADKVVPSEAGNVAALDANGNLTDSGKTVNNAALTIQRNGVTLDSFGANAKTAKTINIEVPELAWTLLVDKSSAAAEGSEENVSLPTGQSFSGFSELLFVYAFASIQIMDTNVVPTSLFYDANGFVLLKDVGNNQQAKVKYVNDSELKFSNTDASWNIKVYGR